MNKWECVHYHISAAQPEVWILNQSKILIDFLFIIFSEGPHPHLTEKSVKAQRCLHVYRKNKFNHSLVLSHLLKNSDSSQLEYK